MPTRLLRHLAAGLLGLSLGIVAPGAVLAQAWPQRPVKLIVPSTPGSSPDVLARMLGRELEPMHGQAIAVDNKPGAGGILATESVARAAPDGYTLLIAHDGNMAVNTVLYKSLPYDPLKHFTPVANLALNELVLLATPSTGVRTFDEFVAFAKARPGQATYASAGNGTPNHVFMEQLLQQIGASMVHVPYRGGAAGVAGLLGDQAQFMIAGVAPALAHVQAGKLVPVAMLQKQRASTLPGVPTIGESVPGFALETWFAVFAPAGTPPAIVQRLDAGFKDVLARPAFRDAMAAQGMAVKYLDGPALMQQVQGDIARYQVLARQIRLEVQ